MTVGVFVLAGVWSFFIIGARFHLIKSFTKLDAAFLVFNMSIIISISDTLLSGETPGWTSMKFHPLLTGLPYLLGRSMLPRNIIIFQKVVLALTLGFGGVTILELLYNDFTSGRPALFGMPHGALLAGQILAVAALAVSARLFSVPSEWSIRSVRRQLALIFALIVVIISLAQAQARGWFFSSILAITLAFFMSNREHGRCRITYLLMILLLAFTAVFLFSNQAYYGRVFSSTLEIIQHTPPEFIFNSSKTCPVLGSGICAAFAAGEDSVSIRLVMYKEALALFIAHPLFGYGIGQFGQCSCAGVGWYPHSTVLQGLAELGLFGGGLHIYILIVCFSTFAKQRRSFATRILKTPSPFLASLFALSVIADQIYGNILMSPLTWFLIGMGSSILRFDRRSTTE